MEQMIKELKTANTEQKLPEQQSIRAENAARGTQPEATDLEVVRGNYFNRDNIPRLTLVNDILSFSNICVDLLDAEYVNVLVSRENKTVQIRKSTRYNLNSIRWFNVSKKTGAKRARKVKSPMLIALLFRELGFDFDHKYRLDGEYRSGDVEELIFYADNPQVFVLDENEEKRKYVTRFPSDWQNSFGIPIREHEDHKLHNFEKYTVLDITLEKVTKVEGTADDREEAARMNELTNKYVKEGGYYG